MVARSRASRLLVAAALLLLAVAVVRLAVRRDGAGDVAADRAPAAAAPPPERATGSAPRAAQAVRPTPAPSSSAETAPDPLDDFARASAWASVDFDAVRDAMPNNLYWQLAMPTTDAALLQEREEIRAYWNTQYGKVLANTGSVEEVDAYFEHRRRLSADYVEFTSYLLDHYGDVLHERDVGMLELARELHLARLEELPRRHAEALERRATHAAAREAWLRDQARFESADVAEPEASAADLPETDDRR